MGAMECARNGCQTACCTRYSSEYGYICSECFEELVKLTDADYCSIYYFMSTPKITNKAFKDSREQLEKEFKPLEEYH